ncbi:MAG: VPLPA-CTERM-specific exosortase XrtD [Pseudomonadota bacterium]
MTLLHTPDFSDQSRTHADRVGYAICVALLVLGVVLFWPGIVSLGDAWLRPEYSHGPLIPVISLFLFLRQMRGLDRIEDPVYDRWPGFLVLLGALVPTAIGVLGRVPDLITYGLILWIYAIVLISFGWRKGAPFWPPVLHLAFMLPLPEMLYWKLSIELQLLSSELGVALIRSMGVPVFLMGNIIDLGIYKLQVAEACSGLRYLFPILSFSYIFAVLYDGPRWHKAVLLISAVPITIVMNAFRIGVIGLLVDAYGIEQAEGFMHLAEGWAVFLACIAILFGFARVLQRLGGDGRSLAAALDLSWDGLGAQARRVRRLRPSAPMLTGITVTAALAGLLHTGSATTAHPVERTSLLLFPAQIGSWTAGPQQVLAPRITEVLDADDYLAASYRLADDQPGVDLFIAWYRSQIGGSGIHSPEVCLPAGGWEMLGIRRQTVALDDRAGAAQMSVNRAIIQQGLNRKLVWYWFEQRGRRMTSDYAAKAVTVLDSIMLGRSDGGLIRVMTDLRPREDIAVAEARLREFVSETATVLPRFVPGAELQLPAF